MPFGQEPRVPKGGGGTVIRCLLTGRHRLKYHLARRTSGSTQNRYKLLYNPIRQRRSLGVYVCRSYSAYRSQQVRIIDLSLQSTILVAIPSEAKATALYTAQTEDSNTAFRRER